jgi:hypothetical protein
VFYESTAGSQSTGIGWVAVVIGTGGIPTTPFLARRFFITRQSSSLT